ncbi:MAG: NADP-dependent malic enzyme [Candidatus Diapherotrites archaeon]
MPDVYEESVALHRKHKGKIETVSKVPIKTMEDLSLCYTPGVAQPCRLIAERPDEVFSLTMKSNMVAVVSDGSAVLGLGNIGPEAALPVMEGKAALFKEFGAVDAFPICLNTQDPDEIVDVVRKISPVFAGINLEDISAPRCFEVESKLMDLGIPVFHDDQHGTAIVVLAAIINASKVTGKEIPKMRVVINGAGAAGTAVAEALLNYGVKDIVVCDSKGIISKGRADLNPYKKELAEKTNTSNLTGDLSVAVKGRDVFIGVSVAGALKKEMVQTMNKGPIIFAMANPTPEIMPAEAKAAGAAVIGTGRSDFPNQINNVLAFPGIFRGAIDAKAKVINVEMKLAAAKALASYVKEPNPEMILPAPLDRGVANAIAKAVADAAKKTGVTR